MSEKLINQFNDSSAHRENVARYFSTRSDFWTVVYTQEDGACNDYMGFHMRRRRDVVLNLLSDCLDRQGAVLDVGCGSGALVVSMTQMGHRVHGVDLSPGMVGKARKYLMEHGLNPDNIVSGAVEKLPFDDNTFDVVTCVGVLEYVCDRKEALKEIKRIVKDDGCIILTMPNIFKLQNILDPYYWFVRTSQYFARHKTEQKTEFISTDGANPISSNINFTNKRCSYRQLESILSDSALAPVVVIGLGYGPFTFFRKKLFSEDFSKKVSDALERTFKRFSRGEGKYFANRWVVCLKKLGP